MTAACHCAVLAFDGMVRCNRSDGETDHGNEVGVA
ncbi:hypothetical protein GGR04_001744 [Aureimonas pseudogalii]|uniref:Uncharacterized protein n=1 Tax=Aureimonas pseudogalii TaxID=1744844 RepID=A0A7W6H3C5_9HYPH|nr:hypothetical protein [Aureimonas pseudogalii]